MLYLFIFGNSPNPRGLGCARTLRYARLYPRQSQASLGGYYGGNHRTSPKSPTFFPKNFQVSHILRKVDTRRKRPRNGIGRATGPPTPPGYGIPTHLPTPKMFMNDNFLAVTYLKHIREHRSKVEKNEGSNTQGLDGPHYRYTLTNYLIQKYDYYNY